MIDPACQASDCQTSVPTDLPGTSARTAEAVQDTSWRAAKACGHPGIAHRDQRGRGDAARPSGIFQTHGRKDLPSVPAKWDVRLLCQGHGAENAGDTTREAHRDEEVITMFARHSHKPHHFAHHVREWLHRCNPYT